MNYRVKVVMPNLPDDEQIHITDLNVTLKNNTSVDVDIDTELADRLRGTPGMEVSSPAAKKAAKTRAAKETEKDAKSESTEPDDTETELDYTEFPATTDLPAEEGGET